MKNKLMVLVKYFKLLYRLYFFVFSAVLNVLKIFIKTDDHLILINSFGGKKYDDSPKILFEAMQKDDRFRNYKIVWAFHNPDKFNISGAKVIKTDTINYFITALKARCWITNSAIERGLKFKGKKTFYFNTWHGTPLKKMGSDISDKNKSFSIVNKSESPVDIMTAQSDFEANIFSRVFNINRKKFLMCGLPRNDIFGNYSAKQKKALKEKLGLPDNKKIILYAPTFREYERDSMKSCVLAPPMDMKKWENELSDNYCLLFRAHYEVGKVIDFQNNEFVKNMTEYPSINELMIVSDILISDYSSIFFDFSIMDKIMLHFCYDYYSYSKNRGMYFDIRNYLNGSDNEDNLIKIIKDLDEKTEHSRLLQFRAKYLNYYGNAVEQSLDCIFENIGG